MSRSATLQWAKAQGPYEGTTRAGTRWGDLYPALRVLMRKGYPASKAVEAIAAQEGLSEKEAARFASAARSWKSYWERKAHS